MKIKKIDISSIFPIIINKIKLIFEDVNRFAKFKFCILYISELTVFVKVNIDNLNDFSKPILSTTKRLDRINKLKKNQNLKFFLKNIEEIMPGINLNNPTSSSRK